MALNALRISAIIVLGGVLLPHGLTTDTSMDTVIEKERETQEGNYIKNLCPTTF